MRRLEGGDWKSAPGNSLVAYLTASTVLKQREGSDVLLDCISIPYKLVLS